MEHNILIVAGEPSGDMRAGELLKELKKLLPDTSFWGIGGNCMEREGADLLEHIRRFSIVGAWEAIQKLSVIRKQYRHLAESIRTRKPDLAILVDYPGFNLKLASFLNREGIPVIYYIIPQIWAWGGGRIRAIKRYVDKALVLFDFEEAMLRDADIECEFVGHPLLDVARTYRSSRDTAEERKGEEKVFTLGLLPGSRETEIRAILPIMLDSAAQISRARNDVRFVIAENSNVSAALYDSLLAGHASLRISRVCDNTFACLDMCDFAIVTSGTATLETAVMEKPMIITYRSSPFTAFMVKLLIKVPFIGLVNLIAGREVVPELLQENATADKISSKVLEIIEDPVRMSRMKEGLREVRRHLGKEGAAARCAGAVKRFIDKKR